MRNPFKKKNQDEMEDLSMVSEYKEPFTWAGFWEHQVIDRYKAIHEYLKERGILAFIMSPFQYRNRLVALITVIIVGIFIGIIPRSMSMVHSLRESFVKPEISQMDADGTSSGPMTVIPLTSGQANNQHVVIFNLQGTTASGVPSTTSGFSVKMASVIGVNPQKIKYNYKVLPMDDNDRLLVLYVNDQKQASHRAKVKLSININGMPGMNSPMTLIMSNQQAVNKIFDGTNINLAALSNPLTQQESQNQGTSIKSNAKALNQVINTYKLNYQRLYAMKIYVKMTPAQLQQAVNRQIAMPTLTDQSTTENLANLDPNHPNAGGTPATLNTEMLYNNKIYKTSSASASDDDDGDGQVGEGNSSSTAQTEISNLSTIFANISSAVATLNQSRLARYQALSGVQQVLNQKLTVSDLNQNMQTVTHNSSSKN